MLQTAVNMCVLRGKKKNTSTTFEKVVLEGRDATGCSATGCQSANQRRWSTIDSGWRLTVATVGWQPGQLWLGGGGGNKANSDLF